MKDPHQDFVAAMHEVRSNLEVRRLMFVVLHVLLPGAVLAIGDCLAGAAHPPALAWFAWAILPLSGALVAAVGFVTCLVLMRCHFGLVVNGAKMECVLHGAHRERPLNWMGVTTNFVVLCALSTGGGAFLLGVPWLPPWAAGAASAALVALVLALLVVNHARANRLARSLAPSWEPADVSRALREAHSTNSLGDTNADVSIVVTMAAALFVGLFAGISNLVAADPQVALPISAAALRTWSLPLGSAFLTASLLLSGRMILRLRQAVAEHSLRLAALREEPDDPWAFRIAERTFLLYLLVQLLTASSVGLLARTFLDAGPAFAIAAAVPLLATWRYVHVLARGRRLGTSYAPDTASGAAPVPGASAAEDAAG